MSAAVEVTKPCNVAFALVLVAWTFKIRSATLYSARVTATVSAGVVGDTVSVAVLVRPPNVAEMVTDVDAVTVLVVTVNVALLLPAGTVTLGGTGTVAAAVLLLASVTAAPPAGAAPLNVTVPTEDEPAITLVGFNVSVVSVTAAGGGVTVKTAFAPTP